MTADVGVLVRAYHARVLRVGRRTCATPEDADDAVQEAFARFAQRPDVQRDPGALAWLFTVVRNACARLLRPFARRKRALGEQVDDADALAGDALSAPEALAQFEVIRGVHAAIDALAPRSREVIILRDLQGLSGARTCDALGIDTAAMKSRLHRARAELRAELVARGVL